MMEKPWYAGCLGPELATMPPATRRALDGVTHCVVCREPLRHGDTLGAYCLDEETARRCGRPPGATTLYGVCLDCDPSRAAEIIEQIVELRGRLSVGSLAIVGRAN